MNYRQLKQKQDELNKEFDKRFMDELFNYECWNEEGRNYPSRVKSFISAHIQKAKEEALSEKIKEIEGLKKDLRCLGHDCLREKCGEEEGEHAKAQHSIFGFNEAIDQVLSILKQKR